MILGPLEVLLARSNKAGWYWTTRRQPVQWGEAQCGRTARISTMDGSTLGYHLHKLYTNCTCTQLALAQLYTDLVTTVAKYMFSANVCNASSSAMCNASSSETGEHDLICVHRKICCRCRVLFTSKSYSNCKVVQSLNTC